MHVRSIDDLRRALLSLDLREACRLICEFIRDYFERSGAERAVIGVSGGVDSSLTLMLTVKALGRDAVLALIMPHRGITPDADVRDALEVVRLAGVEHRIIYVDEVSSRVREVLSDAGLPLDRVSYGNVIARSRMLLLYAFANAMRAIVVGAGDKSEILLGYFTKYGDGGVDILPIGDLYKTQVRLMARMLGIPERIAFKPSSPRLWAGQTAAEELGADYDEIDPILYALVELGMREDDVKEIPGVRGELVESLVRRVRANEHKRMFPRIPKIQRGPTVGIDWKFTVWRRR